MARQNPASFAFSIVFEIVAVVAIVSFLPRIDLRPTASASQSFEPPSGAPWQSPVVDTSSWNASNRVPQQGSFSTSPPLTGFPSTAPPLIADDTARPQYVEQRLDRASQQLLNSVGGAVNQAADQWIRSVPNSGQTEVAARPIINPQPSSPPVTQAPSFATWPQQPVNNGNTQPQRRWLRY